MYGDQLIYRDSFIYRALINVQGFINTLTPRGLGMTDGQSEGRMGGRVFVSGSG